MLGCLLLHGFGGSPFEMMPLASRLEKAGCRVVVPCLPGHGIGIAEFKKTFFPDWAAGAGQALENLARETERQVLIGLSMGGSLSLSLAARRPLAGVVCLSAPVYIYSLMPWRMPDIRLPFLPLLARLRPDWPKRPPRRESREIAPWEGYEGVHCLPQLASLVKGLKGIRASLGRIAAPMLIMHDIRDRVVSVDNALEIAAKAASTDIQIRLTRINENITSRHLITTHRETRAMVEEEVLRFVGRLARADALGQTL